MLAAALLGACASSSGSGQDPGEAARIALRQATGVDWIIGLTPTGSAVNFAAPKDAAYGLPEADGPAEAALAFLSAHRRLFGMQDPQREWVVTPHDAAMSGPALVRFSQAVDGVPVYGASWAMHFDSRGRLTSTSGHYVAGALGVSTRARLSAAAAAARALACVAARAQLPENAFRADLAELEVFPTRAAHPALAWRVPVSAASPRAIARSREVHLDDRSGTVLADASMVIHRRAPEAADPEPAYPEPCLPAGRDVPSPETRRKRRPEASRARTPRTARQAHASRV